MNLPFYLMIHELFKFPQVHLVVANNCAIHKNVIINKNAWPKQ